MKWSKSLVFVFFVLLLFLYVLVFYLFREIKNVNENNKKIMSYAISLMGSNRSNRGRYEDPYIREAVKNRILKGYSEIRECYKSYLSKNPDNKSGSVKMDWEINVEGEVENVGVVKNSLGKEIEKCLVKTISKWRFPKPIVRKYVSHTFNFKYKEESEKGGRRDSYNSVYRDEVCKEISS
jgi:hypothetical protein